MIIKRKFKNNNKFKNYSMGIKREINKNLIKKQSIHFHMAKKRIMTSKDNEKTKLHLNFILNI